jgi:hypothetical protein
VRHHGDVKRSNLKLLDSYLQELEDANEANRSTVTEQMAAQIQGHVPAVRPGMPVSTAINLVLREQERYLVSAATVTEVPAEVHEPLDEVGARDLTEQIKHATRQVCLLLHEAHRRKAWQVLGYQSWEAYVQGEFGLSKSRSYELLDQSRVIRAMQAAAGTSGTPDISAYCAEQIKPYLPEMIESVRVLTVGTSEREALHIVHEVVRERRHLIDQDRVRRLAGADRAEDASSNQARLAQLRNAIGQLASMPPVGEVIACLEDTDVSNFAGVDQALDWLEEFVAAWQRRQPAAVPALVER